MRFTPKTEKEIAEENLLPKGEYNYEVISAADTTSKKSGADMIAVKLRIFVSEDGGITLTDYLMEAMARKLRNFCAQNGLMAQYESGTLRASDCEGKSGVAYVKIEKDKTSQYPDKNAIADYPVKRGNAQDGHTTAPPTFDSGPISDDDVPF
jgi:hypothetical protein